MSEAARTASLFRVVVYLPYRDDKPDYITTINWLVKRFRAKYAGVTVSIHQPLPVFRGFFFDTDEGKYARDRIVCLSCDVPIDPEHDVEELERYLRYLKRHLHLRLPREKEFWITYSAVTRITLPQRDDVLPKGQR